jgi:carotenoid cleavage dioxygenase-like enzyme
MKELPDGPNSEKRPGVCPPGHRAGFQSLNHQVERRELTVEGSVPDWLQGALLRTGPAKFEVGTQSYRHWFDGLAMLHRFAFTGGRVWYQNRFLESDSYREARDSGRISRGEFATDPCQTLFQRVRSWFSPRVTDNCNVNVSRFGNAIVAMTETRLPIRFDPQTLRTLGHLSIDPQLTGPLSTAHPHTDLRRGCDYSYLVDFGYRSVYRVLAVDHATGKQRQLAEIPADRPAYMHSFAMTADHLLFTEFPFVTNPLRMRFSGRPFIENYRWEPDRGLVIHVIDKETGERVRKYETDPVFAFHHVNAYEDGGCLNTDLIAYPDARVIDDFYLDRLRSEQDIVPAGQLTRLQLHADGQVTQTVLAPEHVELPQINEARCGGDYRYVYACLVRRAGEFLNALVKFDLGGNSRRRWYQPACFPGEPVFVPRPGAGAEDDGVLLSVVLNPAEDRSFLLVLDAATMEEAARVAAPHRIPFGFHGRYAAADAG